MEFSTERAACLAMVDMLQNGFKIFDKPRKRNGFWVFTYQDGEPHNFENIQRMKTEEAGSWRARFAGVPVAWKGRRKGEWRHGTWSGYCSHHCRCVDCVTAARRYSKDRYRNKKGKN